MNIKENKIFLKNVAFLAVPIIINEMLNSFVNIMDTFMIGQLGEESVAAVGLANQLFFLFNLLLFGISSGASIFIGQYWGKRDLKSIHKVMGIYMSANIIAAVIFCTLALGFPEFVMSVYSKDKKVIEIGVKYLRIIGVSYFITAFVVGINAALRAMGKAIYPMTTTFISLMCNIIFNYIFIFKLNYGASGAALGTVLARSVEMCVQILLVKIRKLPVVTNIKLYFDFNKQFFIDYVKISLPVVANEFIWALGTSVYNVAYKYSGTNAQAAIQISSTVQNLFMVFGLGIGVSCGILLSNFLGAGNIKKAILYSKKCILLAIIVSGFISIVLVIISPFILSFFNVSDIVYEYTKYIIFVIAGMLVFKTFNYTTIVGILRSGGDTKFCLLLDAAGVWLVGVPCAFIGSALFHFPIYVTFALVASEEVFKLFISGKRVMSNKWARNLIE